MSKNEISSCKKQQTNLKHKQYLKSKTYSNSNCDHKTTTTNHYTQTANNNYFTNQQSSHSNQSKHDSLAANLKQTFNDYNTTTNDNYYDKFKLTPHMPTLLQTRHTISSTCNSNSNSNSNSILTSSSPSSSSSNCSTINNNNPIISQHQKKPTNYVKNFNQSYLAHYLKQSVLEYVIINFLFFCCC